jgi:hypothetical protein
MNMRLILLASAICLLSACTADEPPPPAASAAQPAAPLPNSNVFSTQVRALDKARNVQKIVDQQQQNTDKQLQEADH